MRSTRLIDLTGKRFGKLKVIGRSDHHGKFGGAYWDCRCDCGEIKPYRTDVLRKNGIRSCGCTSNCVKIGEKVGNLTVAEKIKRIPGRRNLFWRCSCDCGSGKDVILSSHAIRYGNVKSCGCLLNPVGERHPSYKGYKGFPGWVYDGIKRGAKTRGVILSVSKKYLWELFEKQNKECALSGMKLDFGVRSRNKNLKREKTASLDRIDNSEGYVDGNVQWVHKDINKMKNTYSQEKFIGICKMVAKKCL